MLNNIDTKRLLHEVIKGNRILKQEEHINKILNEPIDVDNQSSHVTKRNEKA